MSKSVVLDFDLSLKVGRKYWEVLAIQSNEKWNRINIDSQPSIRTWSAGKTSLACSLVYYTDTRLLITNSQLLSELLNEIEWHKFDGVYNYEFIKQVIPYVIETPSGIGLSDGSDLYSTIKDSLLLIESLWPAGKAEIDIYMTGILIMNHESILSLTSASWFGAIFLGKALLNRKSLVETSTAIIHEVAHLVLFAESAREEPLDDLKEKFFSPLVGRDRPALMVLHAQFSMARILIWLLKLHHSVRKFADGIKSVRQLPLTAAGLCMLKDFEAILSIIEKHYT
jgi:hypothetical protein